MVSSDSVYKANNLAWYDFSVAIGIFLFDFFFELNAFCIFLHDSHWYLSPYFACIDLIRIDADDPETISGSMVSIIL